VIRFVHFVFPTIFFAFVFYINIVVIVVGSIVGITIIITGISKDRFVVDFYKRELYFVICKGLKGFKDCNIIRCLAFVRQVEV